MQRQNVTRRLRRSTEKSRSLDAGVKVVCLTLEVGGIVQRGSRDTKVQLPTSLRPIGRGHGNEDSYRKFARLIGYERGCRGWRSREHADVLSTEIEDLMIQQLGMTDQQYDVFSEMQLAKFSIIIHCRKRVALSLILPITDTYTRIRQVPANYIRRQGRVPRSEGDRLPTSRLRLHMVQALFPGR